MKKKFLIIGSILLFFVFALYLFGTYRNAPDVDIDSERGQGLEEINPVERRTEGEFFGEYRVKEGDTLTSISEYFNLQEATILSANDKLQNESLPSGQVLRIPPVDGIVIVVKEEDTLESISKEYDVSEEQIADYNWLSYPYSLEGGMELFIPLVEDL